jgi:hypothetical protein
MVKNVKYNHMIATSFWSADGNPISAEEFLIIYLANCQIFSKAKKNSGHFGAIHSYKKDIIREIR